MARMRMIGMLSGTSHDAVDAVVTDLTWQGPGEVGLRHIGLLSVPFPVALREELTACLPPSSVSLANVCQLDTRLGQFFGTVARRAQEELADGTATWVVSHGQTVYHWVDEGRAHGTLQLGSPSWIAEETGLPVVSDLRSRDIAKGGQGAPLVALLDALLLPDERTGALNLGGIANLTFRSGSGEPGCGRLDQMTAYDLGPACALIDEAARWASGGELRMDLDGRRAARGTVVPELLDRLLSDPYYRLPPPKTTGKEHFHGSYLRERLKVAPGNGPASEADPDLDDVLATVTELTARLVADACQGHQLSALVVSGGGVRNPHLMARIRELAPAVRVEDSMVLGLPPQSKEACLFALLGFLTVHGVASNVPSATGASGAALLGSLTPGAEPLRLPEPVTDPLVALSVGADAVRS